MRCPAPVSLLRPARRPACSSRLSLPRPLHLPPPLSHPAAAAAVATTAGLRPLRAWFVRGGTSNGLLILRDALPASPSQWPDILPAAMGSPDPLHARQLNGMGSGISSTSKVVVLGRPHDETSDIDIEYTFVQVGVRDGSLDTAGNCGNLTAIVGPAAWDLGLVRRAAGAVELDENGNHWATVRLLNTNTHKVIVARFSVEGSPLVYCPEGNYAIDGVPGLQSRVMLGFIDPAGAKTGRALPTGNPIDKLRLPDGSVVAASLVDIGNPGVFVAASSLGLDAAAALTPQAIDADAPLKDRLEQIRRAGASVMGLDPNTGSVPKVVVVLPRPSGTDVDLRCVAMSMGQAHKAVPLTLALCLAAASQLRGTVPAEMMGGEVKDAVTIGHPSGMVDVVTMVRGGRVEMAMLARTARVLMKGEVYY